MEASRDSKPSLLRQGPGRLPVWTWVLDPTHPRPNDQQWFLGHRGHCHTRPGLHPSASLPRTLLLLQILQQKYPGQLDKQPILPTGR